MLGDKFIFPDLLAFLIERLRGNVLAVRPSNGAALDACLPEEIQVPQGSEHGSVVKVLREVDHCATLLSKTMR